MAGKLSPHVAEGAIVLLAVGLAFGAAVVGFAAGREWGDNGRPALPAPAPTGHIGRGLPPHEFGDPAVGARLFVSKGCADCHSYAGAGGTDAPPLDSMSGHLSAREVANMSGLIWNHLPAMLDHFKEEGILVPTFADYEMADLIAYLHSEGQAPASGPSGGGMGNMGGMTTTAP